MLFLVLLRFASGINPLLPIDVGEGAHPLCLEVIRKNLEHIRANLKIFGHT